MRLGSSTATNFQTCLRSTAVKGVLLCFVFVVACSIGCGSPEKAHVEENLASKSLTDVLGIALKNSEEIDFCIADGATGEFLTVHVDKIKEVVGLLPASVASSSSSSDQKSELTQAIEKLSSTCDGMVSAIESNNTSKISSTNKELVSHIKSMLESSK